MSARRFCTVTGPVVGTGRELVCLIEGLERDWTDEVQSGSGALFFQGGFVERTVACVVQRVLLHSQRFPGDRALRGVG